VPSSLEGLFALFGLAIIIVTFMSGTLKWHGVYLPALNKSHRLIARAVGIILVIVAIFIKYAEYYKPLKLKPVLNDAYISDFLSARNINQIRKFPITSEILTAKSRGEAQYQVLVCNDKISGKVAVRSDFKKCPFDDGLPRVGPVLDLSQF